MDTSALAKRMKKYEAVPKKYVNEKNARNHQS